MPTTHQLSLFDRPAPVQVGLPPITDEGARPSGESMMSSLLALSEAEWSELIEDASPLPVPHPPEVGFPASRLAFALAVNPVSGVSTPWRADHQQATARHPAHPLGDAQAQHLHYLRELARFSSLERRYPGEGRVADSPAPETYFEALAHLRRAPRLGDPCPPWAFRGWLAWNAQLCHEAVYGPQNRWDYYLDAFQGALPAGPIPWLDWCRACLAPAGTSQVPELLEMLRQTGQGTGLRGLNLLVQWMAWGLGTTASYPALPDAVAERLYRIFNLAKWIAHPSDYLGEAKAGLTGKQNDLAFFPTPSNVVEMCVRMMCGGTSDLRRARLLDPAVGTGRFLLQASNYSLALFGVDLDPLNIEITKVNGAVYAPWMAWGIPGLESDHA